MLGKLVASCSNTSARTIQKSARLVIAGPCERVLRRMEDDSGWMPETRLRDASEHAQVLGRFGSEPGERCFSRRLARG